MKYILHSYIIWTFQDGHFIHLILQPCPRLLISCILAIGLPTPLQLRTRQSIPVCIRERLRIEPRGHDRPVEDMIDSSIFAQDVCNERLGGVYVSDTKVDVKRRSARGGTAVWLGESILERSQ